VVVKCHSDEAFYPGCGTVTLGIFATAACAAYWFLVWLWLVCWCTSRLHEAASSWRGLETHRLAAFEVVPFTRHNTERSIVILSRLLRSQPGIGRSTSVRLARDFSAIVLAARNAGRTQRGRECCKDCRERSLCFAMSTYAN